jgi:replicative DNA helicase
MRRQRSQMGAGNDDVGSIRRQSKPRRDTPDRPKNETVKVPHDVVNEIVMLSAVIVDQAAASRYLPTISADSFYGQGHAAAWAVLQRLRTQGLSYDPATIKQMTGGAVDTDALEAYVAERPAAPPNLRYHAECIAWDRARVEAVRGPVSEFLEAIRNPLSEPTKVRALARAIGTSFDGMGDRRYLRDPAALIREHKQELEDRRMGRAVFPFGIDGLDYYGEDDPEPGAARLIPGAAPGKLTVVVGVSGSAKSTTTARMALEQARQGRKVLYGAWEQKSAMTLEIVAALSLGWSRTDMMIGRFTEDDQTELLEEMERLSQWIRFLDLPYGRGTGERRTNDANLDLLHQYIADVSPDVFIGDLFRRVLAETDPDDEEQALYRAQAMAQETQAHMILVQQLRLKDVEARPDQRPTRESIKGTSAWIDVADTIIGWYRPALHRNVPDDTIQAIILKQRYGQWPLAVAFDWDPVFGSLDRGRSMVYDKPGTESNDLDITLGGNSFISRGSMPPGGRRKRSSAS